jgi:hypothetical protein
MDADFSQPTVGGDSTTIGKKAWTAYVGVVFVVLVLLVLIAPFVWHWSVPFGAGLALVSVAWAAYKLAELGAYRLYYNEMGVWLYSGILPWNKGVRGVKWRDLDDATYTRSMGSWLLKSYSIRIGHRFTRSNELVLTGIAHGDKAVMTINQKLQEMASSSRLN